MTPTDAPLTVAVLVQGGLFRAALRHALQSLGIEVVDLSVAGRGVGRQPAVVLMEPAHPWAGVEAGLARLGADHPRAVVLLLVERADPREVERWLEIGCAGVVSKQARASELELAIETVRRGVPWVSDAVCPHLLA